MPRFASILAAGSVLLTAGAATSQTAPAIFDMKGDWKGYNEAIVHGPATHHPQGATAKPAGEYRLRQLNVIYRFDGQDGRRFWGTMISEHQANIRMIGSMSVDGKWIYMVGKDGYVDGQVIDADTIEACYRHAHADSAVVACNLMKREK